jgi:hypothetical protein
MNPPQVAVLLAALALGGPACSDDVRGKANGEPCITHDECASKLCTIPPAGQEAGPPGTSTGKICTEPGLT